MKKNYIKIMIAAGIVSLMASCDSKVCYCYEYTSTGVKESETWVDSDKSCKSISSGIAGNMGSKACVESNERLNTGEIAWK